MGIEEPEMISLNKSRQRAVFERPDGKGGWVRTTPLPADPASANYYFLKGFRAPQKDEVKSNVAVIEKPEVKVEIKEERKLSAVDAETPCPFCGKPCKGAFGLQLHIKKHSERKSNKEDNVNV